MSTKPDKIVELSKTLWLCEYKTGGAAGFWLYDETRGMNLAMRAKSELAACVDALTYYQKRLAKVEQEYTEIKLKVDTFVSTLRDENDRPI